MFVCFMDFTLYSNIFIDIHVHRCLFIFIDICMTFHQNCKLFELTFPCHLIIAHRDNCCHRRSSLKLTIIILIRIVISRIKVYKVHRVSLAFLKFEGLGCLLICMFLYVFCMFLYSVLHFFTVFVCVYTVFVCFLIVFVIC